MRMKLKRVVVEFDGNKSISIPEPTKVKIFMPTKQKPQIINLKRY